MICNKYMIRKWSNDEDETTGVTDYWNAFPFLKLHKNYVKRNYSVEEITERLEQSKTELCAEL